jgi:hypothetical protein
MGLAFFGSFFGHAKNELALKAKLENSPPTMTTPNTTR